MTSRLLAPLGVIAALALPPALWQLSLERAVGREMLGLGHRDEAVRQATVARLSAMGPEIVPILVGGFAEERGGGGPRAVEDPDAPAPITSVLMNLLRDLEDPGRIDDLLDAMGDPDEDVRHYAGLTLAYIGEEAVPALQAALREAPDPRRRTAAAWVLSFMGAAGTAAVPALREALQDPDKDVRYTARYALEQLTDEGGALWQAVDRARQEPGR